LKKNRKASRGITLYADDKTLHDKISLKSESFEENIKRVKKALKNNKYINIGISRFNFFKIHEIIRFCYTLMGRRLDLRSVSLPLFPTKKLYYNFIDYLQELTSRIGSKKIRFFLKDEKLLDLLYSISKQADQYNERELLRLLGVISEHPFIGPQTIVLDTYHNCNTNCLHCWIHTPRRKLSPALNSLKMDFSLYKNIIDNAAELLCDEVIIQGDGEPLLDKRFPEMVQYARDKGLKVLFFTNAILLDKRIARRIIDLEIDEIFCSLPAGTEATYARINPRQSKQTFRKITKNLKDFISMRDKSGKKKPWLQMTHVIHNLNYHEVEEMAKLDTYIGADKVRFYLVRLDKNINFLKLKSSHIHSIKESVKNIAPFLKKKHIELQDNICFQLKNYSTSTGHWSASKLLKSCPVGWFFSLVLAKGEVSMCCHLRVIDILKEKSFKDIWNSSAYNKFRIKAKYLMDNKNTTFSNDVKLYNEFCKHCDTHQVILRINELFDKYKLTQFL
ncbi:radical SAM protein, partial [Candidatus Omnitrophota bacterium]